MSGGSRYPAEGAEGGFNVFCGDFWTQVSNKHMEVALTHTQTHIETVKKQPDQTPLLPPGGLCHSLLVSFFWLVGVVAQLTLTSCGGGSLGEGMEEGRVLQTDRQTSCGEAHTAMVQRR